MSSGPEVINSKYLQDLCCESAWRAAEGDHRRRAPSIDIRDVGRWGEALVYQYLVLEYPTATVTWVNHDSETMSCYDIRIEQPMRSSTGEHIVTTFVEVKTSRFDNLKTFDISLNEWEFASGVPPIHFDVYRVFNAGDPKRVRIQIVKDLYKSVKEHSVRLCITL